MHDTWHALHVLVGFVFLNCKFYFKTSHTNDFREMILIWSLSCLSLSPYQLSGIDHIVENEGVV